MFGATLDVSQIAGIRDLPPDTLVPGVAVYSRRADPLAGWTNGLELAALTADTDRWGSRMHRRAVLAFDGRPILHTL